ncbi:hypothetical protein LINPERHAP2_LOCUS15168 [Linum perenne]
MRMINHSSNCRLQSVVLAVLLLICFSASTNSVKAAAAAAAAAANQTLLLNHEEISNSSLHLYDDDDDAGVEDLEVELLMESGSSSESMRMLQGRQIDVRNSLNGNHPSYGCGRGQNYCLPDKVDRKLYCDSRSRDPRCHRR